MGAIPVFTVERLYILNEKDLWGYYEAVGDANFNIGEAYSSKLRS